MRYFQGPVLILVTVVTKIKTGPCCNLRHLLSLLPLY